MEGTKTTFYLRDSLRTRLKVLAARRRKTVTALLTEGAELVVAKYQGQADQEELARRARKARERMRHGLYAGPAVAEKADELVYGVRAPRRSERRR